MKVGIVGVGLVGSTAAFAMALEGAASEVVLVDKDENLAAAQAEDILHATPHGHPVNISAGRYEKLNSAGVIVLSCGVGQKEGESRLELLGRNAEVFEEVIPQVVEAAPEALLIVASNPVDIITQITTKISGLPTHQVIGSGTILDTARFRSLVGSHLGIAARSVHGYVLGEHGDSEVLIWSGIRVGGIPLEEFSKQIGKPVTDTDRRAIEKGVRKAAYRIIDGKGATNYGIGAGLSRIVRAIRDNERAVLSLSSMNRNNEGVAEVCFSVPRILGSAGLASELWPPISSEEHTALRQSVAVIEDSCRELGYL